MIAGSLVVGACLLVLGWTSEIVGIFVKDANKVLLIACFRDAVPIVGDLAILKYGLEYTNLCRLTGQGCHRCCRRSKYLCSRLRH